MTHPRAVLGHARLVAYIATFGTVRDALVQRCVCRTWLDAVGRARIPGDGYGHSLLPLTTALQPLTRQLEGKAAWHRLLASWADPRVSAPARAWRVALPSEAAQIVAVRASCEHIAVCFRVHERAPSTTVPAVAVPMVVAGDTERASNLDISVEKGDMCVCVAVYDFAGHLVTCRTVDYPWNREPNAEDGTMEFVWPFVMLADDVTCRRAVCVFHLEAPDAWYGALAPWMVKVGGPFPFAHLLVHEGRVKLVACGQHHVDVWDVLDRDEGPARAADVDHPDQHHGRLERLPFPSPSVSYVAVEDPQSQVYTLLAPATTVVFGSTAASPSSAPSVEATNPPADDDAAMQFPETCRLRGALLGVVLAARGTDVTARPKLYRLQHIGPDQIVTVSQMSIKTVVRTALWHAHTGDLIWQHDDPAGAEEYPRPECAASEVLLAVTRARHLVIYRPSNGQVLHRLKLSAWQTWLFVMDATVWITKRPSFYTTRGDLDWTPLLISFARGLERPPNVCQVANAPEHWACAANGCLITASADPSSGQWYLDMTSLLAIVPGAPT